MSKSVGLPANHGGLEEIINAVKIKEPNDEKNIFNGSAFGGAFF